MGLVLFCAGDIAVNQVKPVRLISRNGERNKKDVNA